MLWPIPVSSIPRADLKWLAKFFKSLCLNEVKDKMTGLLTYIHLGWPPYMKLRLSAIDRVLIPGPDLA